jgi:hypothetical protein
VAESRTTYQVTIGLGVCSVELYGDGVEPQFVNPENLKFNGVVDEEWTCNRVQIGITESAIGYTNGLHIDASENSVSFGHVPADNVPLSAESASRYVKSRVDNEWVAVVFEYLGTIELATESDSADRPLQPHLLEELVHDDVIPAFRSGALYQYPDRILQIELLQPVDSGEDQIEWRASVSRSVASDEEGQTKDRLLAILSGWDTDRESVIESLLRLVRATLRFGGD